MQSPFLVTSGKEACGCLSELPGGGAKNGCRAAHAEIAHLKMTLSPDVNLARSMPEVVDTAGVAGRGRSLVFKKLKF